MASASAAALAPPISGTVLICDQALIHSRLVEGSAAGILEPEIYARLTEIVLDCSGFDVIVHVGNPHAPAHAIRHAVEQVGLPSARARVSVVDAVPLQAVLARVDVLVSFASPALIEGCRRGLKPIQIGRALTGSGEFSHIFADLGQFADALSAGALGGCLSMREYEKFVEFCQRVQRRAALWRMARDPVARECRRLRRGWLSWISAVASAITHPVIALRLVRGNFPWDNPARPYTLPRRYSRQIARKS